MSKGRVIAAVRTDKELMAAIKSNTDTIFMLAPNIQDIKRQIDAVHTSGKRIFVHIDLAEGIGKDEHGIRFSKEQGFPSPFHTPPFGLVPIANTPPIVRFRPSTAYPSSHIRISFPTRATPIDRFPLR